MTMGPYTTAAISMQATARLSAFAGRRVRAWPAWVGLAFLLAGLPPLVAAEAPVSQTPFVAIGGIPAGARLDSVDWLVPSTASRSTCAGESHYAASDAGSWFTLARTRLAAPGLVYKFHDGQLYALEGGLRADRHAFDALLDTLTRRYGRPDVMENWAGSPRDSFTYRERLRMAGWFDTRAKQNIWLTGYRQGGSIRVVPSAAAATSSWLGEGCDAVALSPATIGGPLQPR